MKTTIKLILPAVLIAGLFLVSSCGSTEEKTDETNNENVEETKAVKTVAITESFKVFGNCTMCQERIEKAALAVEGVTKASWSTETKMIDLSLDNADFDVEKVQMAIANVGHDTQVHKAKGEVYNELPGCCQYDRTGEASNEHDHDHDHEGHQH